MLRSCPSVADLDNLRTTSAVGALRSRGIDVRMLPAPADAFPMYLIDTARSRPEQVGLELSTEERARALRYRNDALRNRYTIAHGCLRIILLKVYGIPMDAYQLSENEFGKPYLSSAPQVHFNMSYSAEFALIGVCADGEIGVDIESMRLIEDAGDLAELHFTSRERRDLQSARPSLAELSKRFLRTWVKKEACVKALGSGLDIPLDEVECGSGDEVRLVQMPDRQQCRTGLVECWGDPIVGWARSVA